MAEADWSDLPKELVNLISQRIDIEIDLIRFRSVCSNWRRSSSVSNHHLKLTINFPLLKSLSDSTITSSCCLSKRSIFLIKPPPQQQTLIRPWLIRIAQSSNGKTKCFHPFISHLSPSTSFCVPRLFDFHKLSVLHLVTDFITNELAFQVLLPQKVISIGKHSLFLGILKNCTTQLVLFRCGNEPWEWIPDISMTYGDICVFKGRFYAVDKFGRTVMIGPDSKVQLDVAEHVVDGGDRKLLVESDGELLLVDIYESLHFSIKVFRFHEKEKKWVKMMNLGDRVLFLGNGCSFSASASDLCVSKGNCIIFIDDAIPISWMQGGNGVYHLDQDRVSSVPHYHEYFNLFSPPPDWILMN